jgi:phosphoenolpyruvate carboxylase
MKHEQQELIFNQRVLNKYHLYNSLFLKLPYERIKNIGILIPILTSYGQEKLSEGMSPIDIVDSFFERFTNVKNQQEKISYMQKIVQYVERQVVLFDSVEDAAFNDLKTISDQYQLSDIIKQSELQQNSEDLINLLSKFSIRLVFTAHPTQFYPPSVQYILHDLKEAIQNDDVEKIDILLQQLGQTPFYSNERPSPVDEANSIIYYLRNVYYDAIGELYQSIKKNLPENNDFANTSLLKIGFWPGGDRDGNPFVTHEITAEVAKTLKNTLMKCYYDDLKKLRRRITFADVSGQMKQLSNKLYSSLFDVNAVMDYKEMTTVLENVLATIHTKYNGLFADEVESFIDKINMFKLHFASLDIRQDSSIHRNVIKEIESKYGKEVKLIDYHVFEDALVKDTLLNIAQLGKIQEKNGEESCHRYIISNSELASDVLDVLHMFKYTGYKNDDIKMDIIPLFETMQGLDSSIEIMSTLFENEEYKAHLKNRNNKQTIMLGFSDGTKDGGYLKANWEIYKAKMELTKLCKKYEVKVLFFDGRGGPPARGGGKTQKFYASQGQNISNEEIQLTIQGQTITSMYGNKDQFIHNCEQLIMAGVKNDLYNAKDTRWNEDQLNLMEELAQLSHKKYLALKEHDLFLSYLEKRSTLKYYTKTNIGSRPGKRGGDDKLKFSDLRAIPFVGSWSQLKQNIPGFYGIGSALDELKKEGRLNEVKDLYRNSSFFKTLILNSMMALQKSYFSLTSYLKNNEEFKDFWQMLFSEYKLTKDLILEISGQQSLMQEEWLSRSSIDVREEIVLPLLLIQQYALEALNNESMDVDRERYEKLVIRSLFGNINASRNSA